MHHVAEPVLTPGVAATHDNACFPARKRASTSPLAASNTVTQQSAPHEDMRPALPPPRKTATDATLLTGNKLDLV